LIIIGEENFFVYFSMIFSILFYYNELYEYLRYKLFKEIKPILLRDFRNSIIIESQINNKLLPEINESELIL